MYVYCTNLSRLTPSKSLTCIIVPLYHMFYPSYVIYMYTCTIMSRFVKSYTYINVSFPLLPFSIHSHTCNVWYKDEAVTINVSQH